MCWLRERWKTQTELHPYSVLHRKDLTLSSFALNNKIMNIQYTNTEDLQRVLNVKQPHQITPIN